MSTNINLRQQSYILQKTDRMYKFKMNGFKTKAQNNDGEISEQDAVLNIEFKHVNLDE